MSRGYQYNMSWLPFAMENTFEQMLFDKGAIYQFIVYYYNSLHYFLQHSLPCPCHTLPPLTCMWLGNHLHTANSSPAIFWVSTLTLDSFAERNLTALSHSGCIFFRCCMGMRTSRTWEMATYSWLSCRRTLSSWWLARTSAKIIQVYLLYIVFSFQLI